MSLAKIWPCGLWAAPLRVSLLVLKCRYLCTCTIYLSVCPSVYLIIVIIESNLSPSIWGYFFTYFDSSHDARPHWPSSALQQPRVCKRWGRPLLSLARPGEAKRWGNSWRFSKERSIHHVPHNGTVGVYRYTPFSGTNWSAHVHYITLHHTTLIGGVNL
jgi:hypothetical protein